MHKKIAAKDFPPLLHHPVSACLATFVAGAPLLFKTSARKSDGYIVGLLLAFYS
jgi:hypothetical protein